MHCISTTWHKGTHLSVTAILLACQGWLQPYSHAVVDVCYHFQPSDFHNCQSTCITFHWQWSPHMSNACHPVMVCCAASGHDTSVYICNGARVQLISSSSGIIIAPPELAADVEAPCCSTGRCCRPRGPKDLLCECWHASGCYAAAHCALPELTAKT